MEGNNKQQRQRSRERSHDRSQERSPETSPVMVPATQPRSPKLSCCLGMASDEPVDIPASNVPPDSIVKPPTRQSHVNNPDTNEHIICSEYPKLQALLTGAKRPSNPQQPGSYSRKKDKGGDQDGRNEFSQGSSQKQNQDKKIKFLINVPMWVQVPNSNQPEDQIRSQVQRLLTLLEKTGFQNADKEHLEDVAIIIGLNGKYSVELSNLLCQLVEKNDGNTTLTYKKISFTWGPGGDIEFNPKPDSKQQIPYTDIREYLKDHAETKNLVKELRKKCTDVIYFSFIDADTVNFNQVYSSYLEIVKQHSNTHNDIPPTVMSTGYEFPDGDFKIASQVDNDIRCVTAQHFSLGTYYPEPNFCVLLLEGEDTLKESFIGRGKEMESPNMMRKLKERDKFTAVFTKGNPIVTTVPARFKVTEQCLRTAQSHYQPRVWATSAYMHCAIKSELKGIGSFGKTRKHLMALLTCPDEEFKEKCADLPLKINTAYHELCMAAAAVREYKKKVREAENQRDESRQAESRAKQSET